MSKIKSYREFWPYYLSEHRLKGTRVFHYTGTTCGLITILIAIILKSGPLFFVAIVSGYAFAWMGHIFVEHNKPATFTYPLWSLISDFRMYFLAISGKLNKEFENHGQNVTKPGCSNK